jgi:hypothetical protein
VNTTVLRSIAAGLVIAASRSALPAVAAGLEPPPLLEAHCFDCHANGAAEGEFALDELLAAEPSAETVAQWRKVWKMVRQEFMPPADAAPLDGADRKAIVHWVQEAALGIEEDNPDPGRVTMRRLNRVEYEYTVGDLFGVDLTTSATFPSDSPNNELRLRDLLPPDDTAYGFDNIGDFQSLSPALLEKYFEIAETVVSRVLVTEGPWYPTERLEPGRVRVERPRGDERRVDHEVRFNLAEPGKYQVNLQFTIGGWQEYGGGFDFRYTVDDVEAAAEPLEVGGQDTRRYRYEAKLAAGEHVVRLVTSAIKADSEGRFVHLELRPRIEVTGPISPEKRSYPESHQRIFFAGEPPADKAEWREYARQILERIAGRAFRRPADAGTIERLTELALAADTLERGVADALVAILTSPRFLFRTELQPQPDDAGVRHELDDYALASRLSYLMWLSLPDDELTQLAAAGLLRENLPNQVRRMLADEKSERFFEDFAGQWLRTRNVLMTPISREEQVIDRVRSDMKRETELLFDHIARGDRDLIELITADYTFLNERLAEHYEIDGVEGDEFRQVALPAGSHRGGMLTHGSFLVGSSNPDRTSPVKRGLFVLENLLATQPPAPPANVPALEDAKSDGRRLRTVREQLEVHRADPSCAACHAHFDPIGIVLENFDILGRWRDEERGETIDPTTTTVTGDELAGIDDLRDYVAGNRERFYRCCTEKLMTYSLGRGLAPFDAVTVDQITARVMADGGKFSTLLLAVVESPAFQTRRGDGNTQLEAPESTVPEIPPPEERRPQRRRGRRRERFDEERAERPEAAAAIRENDEASDE